MMEAMFISPTIFYTVWSIWVRSLSSCFIVRCLCLSSVCLRGGPCQGVCGVISRAIINGGYARSQYPSKYISNYTYMHV